MRLRFATALLALALIAASAHGGGPQAERIAGHESFAKGALEGLSLDADGVLRPGPVFNATMLDCDTAWAALADGDDVWIGLGEPAAVARVDAGGALTRTRVGDGLMVTALAPLPGGGVAAAAFPGGRIYKVGADGAVTLHATLPVEHVWALDADERGALTAACGTPGTLYTVDPFGAPTKGPAVDDEHARCLVPSDKPGAFFVGTAPKGRVLEIEGESVRVLRDLEPQEVVGIVPLGEDGLLIAANADEAGGNAERLAGLVRRIAEPQATKPGAKPAERAALQDGTIFHLEPTGVLTELWSEKKVAVLGLVGAGAGAVAGTYPSGRVIRVQPGAPSALLADLPEAEASVTLGGAALAAVVTSNPAVLYRRKADVNEGTWTSAPIDGTGPSQWGRVGIWGTGVSALAFRTGATEEPDDTWSAWKQLADFDGQGGSVGARARFLQLRASLKGEDASLRAIEVVTRTPNRSPVITELSVAKPGEKKDAAPKADPKREITWKVEDKDDDTLRTTIEVNRRGSPHWAKLVEGEVLDKTTWTWDTTGVPDGIYQVALTVDDGASNEADRVRRTRRVYVGLRIDNTAPVATVRARRFSGGRLAVEGSATDAGGGRIVSARVSIDGGDWVPVAPEDGLYDESEETFKAMLRAPTSGAHDIVVQVTDADGNIGSAATVVR